MKDFVQKKREGTKDYMHNTDFYPKQNDTICLHAYLQLHNSLNK